jgi:hypothetical protein
MVTCRIYGLGVRVNVPIAGLRGLAAPGSIDVSIEVGSMPNGVGGEALTPGDTLFVSDELGGNGEPTMVVSRLGGGTHYRIAYDDGTQVVVDARGAGIWATGPATATIEDTATYLLGPALGFVLRLRGINCLHASAVAINGKAVVFVGPAGAGKSTTAAAFARHGYPILTDDIAPLVIKDGVFAIEPAYPRIRLWPDSVAALFGTPDALPRITPTWDKRYLDLDGGQHRFQGEALPLGAVYILGPRSAGCAPRTEDIDARTAFMSLVSDTYTTRLIDGPLRAREFATLGRLVEDIPVRRLIVGQDASRASDICGAVGEDLRALGLEEDRGVAA